jgi:SAM-dependent methyltransferase
LLHCPDCGVRYTDRIGAGDELARYYDRVLAHHGKAEPLEGQPDSLLAIAREQADTMERILGPRRHGSFLELGCARGHLLEEMEARGWDVVGVDISERATAEARTRTRGIVQTGTVECLEPPAGGFDRVAAFDVLAHLPDPVTTFRNLTKLLRPGGDLVLSTVNEDWPLVPWLLRAFRAAPEATKGLRAEMYEAQHYAYFGEGNIGRLCERVGLDLVSVRPLEPLSTRFFVHQYGLRRRVALLGMVKLDRLLGSSRKMILHARRPRGGVVGST